jgi:hypothetical protein
MHRNIAVIAVTIWLDLEDCMLSYQLLKVFTEQ